MNRVYMNIADLFGSKELPQGELRLRRSKAVVTVLVICAISMVIMGVIAFMSGGEGKIAAYMLAACAVILVICAIFARGSAVTISDEGIRTKRGGEETLCPYSDVIWYEFNTGDTVVMHFDDCNKVYRGPDCRLLTGALRASGVPSFDPDDTELGPECRGVKHIAGRKTAVAALLCTAALMWAMLLVPGLEGEAKTVVLITCAFSSILLAAVAYCLWRQKIELYDDSFRIRKAFGGFKEFGYDDFASRAVIKVRSNSNTGSLDMVLYNVVLYTNEGRRLEVQNSLLIPELLERVGFDYLPYRDR